MPHPLTLPGLRTLAEKAPEGLAMGPSGQPPSLKALREIGSEVPPLPAPEIDFGPSL